MKTIGNAFSNNAQLCWKNNFRFLWNTNGNGNDRRSNGNGMRTSPINKSIEDSLPGFIEIKLNKAFSGIFVGKEL